MHNMLNYIITPVPAAPEWSVVFYLTMVTLTLLYFVANYIVYVYATLCILDTVDSNTVSRFFFSLEETGLYIFFLSCGIQRLDTF